MALSQKLRFEVFKRDKFTCQYCGAKAPDVVLECDHVHPRAAGGSDDILNLVSACQSCNRGKSDRLLSDDSAVVKQRAQLEELAERREQLEMLVEWRQGLMVIDDLAIDALSDFWERRTEFASTVSATGRDMLRRVRGKYSSDEIMAAMDTAVTVYARRDGDDNLTVGSLSEAFDKLPGVLHTTKQSETRPYLRDLFYIRGILRRRLDYVNEGMAIAVMEEAVLCGVPMEAIKSAAIRCSSWSAFRRTLLDCCGEGGL